MIFALFLMQAATAAAPPPDIELNVRLTARSVRIERKGEAKLEVRAGPDAGSRVETKVSPPANGSVALGNVTVDVHAEARLGDPRQNPKEGETGTPQ